MEPLAAFFFLRVGVVCTIGAACIITMPGLTEMDIAPVYIVLAVVSICFLFLQIWASKRPNG